MVNLEMEQVELPIMVDLVEVNPQEVLVDQKILMVMVERMHLQC